MIKTYSILLAESSEIIRSGLISILQRLDNIEVKAFYCSDFESFKPEIKKASPDLLIINPSLPGLPHINQIRKETGNSTVKCVALQLALTDDTQLRQFDETINLFDSSTTIQEKIMALLIPIDDEQVTEQLTNRESEVLIWLIKGLTNKEIATKMFLSTHTIITHRKNIASKLKIHSTAGLTIYAIVNKLISLEEIKKAQYDLLNRKP